MKQENKTYELIGGDHWVSFGDGNAARIIENEEYVKRSDGKKYIKFMLIPSTRMNKTFELKKLEKEEEGINFEYPLSEVIWMERSVRRSRVLVITHILGNETPINEYINKMQED